MNLIPTCVVAASGFSDPLEQWNYSIKRESGGVGALIFPVTYLFFHVKFGNLKRYNSVRGINASQIPILIIQAANDIFYGKISSIYHHKKEITNPLCKYIFISREYSNGHSDYFWSDEALRSRSAFEGESKNVTNENIKELCTLNEEVFTEIADFLNEFPLDNRNNKVDKSSL